MQVLLHSLSLFGNSNGDRKWGLEVEGVNKRYILQDAENCQLLSEKLSETSANEVSQQEELLFLTKGEPPALHY